MKKLICPGMILSLTLVLNSCARVLVRYPTYPPREVMPKPSASIFRQDITHTVAPGETLWCISKMYNVGIKDIMQQMQ